MSADKNTMETLALALKEGDFHAAVQIQLADVLRYASAPTNTPEQALMATSAVSTVRGLLVKFASDAEVLQHCAQLVMAGRQLGIAEAFVASNAVLSAQAGSQAH